MDDPQFHSAMYKLYAFIYIQPLSDICVYMCTKEVHYSQQHWSYQSKIRDKCPSTVGWVNKLWHAYTVECYIAGRKNDLLVYTAQNFTKKMLSKRSQTQKDAYL